MATLPNLAASTNPGLGIKSPYQMKTTTPTSIQAPAPVAPPPANPMGAQAKSPQQNVQPPIKVLPSTQTVPPATSIPPSSVPPPVSPIPSDNTGLYGQLIGKGVEALNQSAALTGQMRKAQQDVAGNPNYSLDTQVGRQGLIQQNVGTQAQALAEQGNAYLSGAGYAKPQVTSYGQTAYNPVTNTFGTSGGATGVDPSDPFYKTMQTYAQLAVSGQGNQIPANITSNPALQAQLTQMAQQLDPNFDWNKAGARGAAVGSFESQIQDLDSKTQSITDNLKQLKTYAQQIGGGNPVSQGVLQAYGSTLEGKTAVSNYQNQLAALSQLISETTNGAVNIPDNLTPDQVDQLSQQVTNFISKKRSNLVSQQSSAQGGGSAGGSNDPLGIR